LIQIIAFCIVSISSLISTDKEASFLVCTIETLGFSIGFQKYKVRQFSLRSFRLYQYDTLMTTLEKQRHILSI